MIDHLDALLHRLFRNSITELTADTQVRFQMIQMIERCPSGRLGYAVDEERVARATSRSLSLGGVPV